MITAVHIQRAINRLNAVYPTPSDPEGTLREWSRQLLEPRKAITEAELDAALDSYLGTDERFFPPPGVLWDLVKARRGNQPWKPRDDDQPRDPDGFRTLLKAFAEAGGDPSEYHDRRRRFPDDAA